MPVMMVMAMRVAMSMQMFQKIWCFQEAGTSLDAAGVKTTFTGM